MGIVSLIHCLSALCVTWKEIGRAMFNEFDAGSADLVFKCARSWPIAIPYLHGFDNLDLIVIVEIVVSPGIFRGGITTLPRRLDWPWWFGGSRVTLSRVLTHHRPIWFWWSITKASHIVRYINLIIQIFKSFKKLFGKSTGLLSEQPCTVPLYFLHPQILVFGSAV